jgi:oligoribonuclease NrnB/cAMP/cGMP phosphodiesterase (DHH superfamily)
MSGKKVLCFYHNDMDGRCSAAIVRRALGEGVNLTAMDYGDPIPWQLVEQVDRVIIVDFSFSLDDMNRISSMTELTWIDHHVTALTDLISLRHIPGARALEHAACVLTWNTYFPDNPLPMAVLYVGDRDIWKHEYPQTKPFGEGLFHEDTNPENDQLWNPLLNDEHSSLEELISRGEVLYKARIKRGKRLVRSKGFELEFEGRSTLALNISGTGDLGELIHQQGYEIGYCYSEAAQNGEIVTFVTLYSDSVDVSEIAKKFGGGGHKGAAGFSFQRVGLPFPENSKNTLKT